MSEKERQIISGTLYLVPVILSNILPFLTLPIFTRILTTEDYGILALAYVYAILINGIANFGMSAAYNRNFFQYRSDKFKTAQLLYSVLVFVLVNFFIFGSLTYLFSSMISRFMTGSGDHGAIIFWVLCGNFLLGICNNYYLTYFRNNEDPKRYVAYMIGGVVLAVVVSFICVVFLRTGVIGLAYGPVCSWGGIFLVLNWNFIKQLKPAVSWQLFVEMFKIAFPLTPRIFFGVINTQFDKYMLGLLAAIGGVGVYSIGQKIAYLIFSYMTALENVFLPQVYKRMFDPEGDGGDSIGRYLTPFVYVSVALALALSMFSEEIMIILTPESYHGAVDIVIVLSMFYGFLFFGKLSGNQLIFMKKTHITSLLSVISIGLNVGFNIPFIMRWGTIGAAWATLLAGLISGAISFVVAQHYYAIKWEYKNVGMVYFAFVGASSLMVLMRSYDLPYEVHLISKCVFVTIYIFIGFNLRVITRENILLIKRLLTFKKATVP